LRLQVQRGAAAAAHSSNSNSSVHNHTQRIDSSSSSKRAAAVHYTSMIDGIQKMYKVGGVCQLFKGAGARVAFHAPTTAIMMLAYEECKAFYANILS
jgi:Mitochondrial carrier protein